VVFDYEGTYEQRRKAMGCDFVPGSLRELAMIRDWFEGSDDPVTVYLMEMGEEPSKECNNPAVDERAWSATTSEEVWIDTRFCHELRGSGIPDIEEPDPRKYRRLPAFFDEMLRRIMPLAEVDFVECYFYRKMVWNGREIEHIYFNNRDCRKVFLQHGFNEDKSAHCE
jgi:hypothetical protein